MIEAAAACPGDMRDDSVHHLAALFVGVEVLVEKMAEKAPTLRNAYRVNALHRCGGLRIVFQIGEEIADGGEAEADNHGIYSLRKQLRRFFRPEIRRPQ